MNIPNNCAECPYTNICPSPHYGGDECKYENEIREQTINTILRGSGFA